MSGVIYSNNTDTVFLQDEGDRASMEIYTVYGAAEIRDLSPAVLRTLAREADALADIIDSRFEA